MRAAFIDKDGTLVENVPHNVDPRLLRFTPGSLEGLRLLHEAGYAIVVATNQSGLARGLFTRPQMECMRGAVIERLEAAGIPVAGYYICPHDREGRLPEYSVECACRKPKPGMLLRAARELHLDLEDSWMIGDILDDVEAGRRAGCRTVLVDRGGETEWVPGPYRRPHEVVADVYEAATSIVATARRARLKVVGAR